VITTPLMMIGTWYGMNFQDMPELRWKHGYLIAFVVMILWTVGTFWYFRKRGWIDK
jgi:magnesium transporter